MPPKYKMFRLSLNFTCSRTLTSRFTLQILLSRSSSRLAVRPTRSNQILESAHHSHKQTDFSPACHTAATPTRNPSFILGNPQSILTHLLRAGLPQKTITLHHRAEQACRRVIMTCKAIPWTSGSSTTESQTVVCPTLQTSHHTTTDNHSTSDSKYMESRTCFNSSGRTVEVHDHRKARLIDDEPRASNATSEDYKHSQARKDRRTMYVKS